MTREIDRVFDPKSGQVFVFGSNLAGIHGAGAARYARSDLGAAWGVGEGPMPDAYAPRCYALPTKDKNLLTLPLNTIARHAKLLLFYAEANPQLTFFVTRVGCGLAGLTDEQLGPMFNGAPENCILPHGWGKIDS